MKPVQPGDQGDVGRKPLQHSISGSSRRKSRKKKSKFPNKKHPYTHTDPPKVKNNLVPAEGAQKQTSNKRKNLEDGGSEPSSSGATVSGSDNTSNIPKKAICHGGQDITETRPSHRISSSRKSRKKKSKFPNEMYPYTHIDPPKVKNNDGENFESKVNNLVPVEDDQKQTSHKRKNLEDDGSEPNSNKRKHLEGGGDGDGGSGSEPSSSGATASGSHSPSNMAKKAVSRGGQGVTGTRQPRHSSISSSQNQQQQQ